MSRFEFKACLASLGNVYDDDEFEKIFTGISGGADLVSFEQFTKFMVSITEDRTTKDQLKQSFSVLAGEKVKNF